MKLFTRTNFENLFGCLDDDGYYSFNEGDLERLLDMIEKSMDVYCENACPKKKQESEK